MDTDIGSSKNCLEKIHALVNASAAIFVSSIAPQCLFFFIYIQTLKIKKKE